MRMIADFLGINIPGGGPSGPSVRNPGKAVYKSPKGNRIPFDFEDVESSIATKAAIFENAAGNGTYVQPNGHTSGRFPMVAFFHGDGHEAKAEAFIGAMLEPGVGQLSHPSYATPIQVVPVGEIRRIDAYKSAANQTSLSVEFFETTGLKIGGAGDLPQLFDSFIDASAVDFSDKARLSGMTDQKSFANKVRKVVKTIQQTMKIASQGAKGITQRIEDAGDSVDRGMDLLIGQPLALARQTQILIGEPRRQAKGTRAKLAGYQNLADDIFSGIAEEPSKYSNERLNNFHMDKLAVGAIVGNYAMLATEGSDEYNTRADYILEAERLRNLADDYQDWVDANYTALSETNISESATDTGAGMEELRGLVAWSLSDLITKSFSAKTEMRAALSSDRSPIDLCFELYGTTAADTMDLFLFSNDISGDEHFIIEKGREIVWYV